MLMHEPRLGDQTLRSLIIERASYGDKPLLTCRGQTLTYGDADVLSNRMANAMLQRGIQHGDVVATYMYNSISHALAWLACSKIGAVWAPYNVSLAPDDLVYTLQDTGPEMIIVDSDLLETYLVARERVGACKQEFLWDSSEGDVSRAPDFEPFERLLEGDDVLPDMRVRPEDPAAIVYTGGSTSMPKGVLVSHQYYIAAAIRYKEIAEATEDDVHFANSHFFHVGGQQFGLSGPLFCGMSSVMSKWFSASKYWDVVKEHGVTVIDPLGTMLAALMSRPEAPGDSDHSVRVGIGIASGQVRPQLREEFETRFGIPLLEVYSMTEFGVLVCSERLNDRRKGSSGRTHGWADVVILDETDQPLPAGEVGQIGLRPNTLNSFMMEYINKPEETVAAWKNLWYHSGDTGYLDKDGYLYFVGRQAHWIRRRGENVSAFEVEKAIAAHHAVEDCAVVGVPSELGEEDIKAYVQLVDGQECLPRELVDWCEERIAFFKVPRYVEFVSSFPRTIAKAEIARHELKDRGIGQAWDRNGEGA